MDRAEFQKLTGIQAIPKAVGNSLERLTRAERSYRVFHAEEVLHTR
jgi:hypothetical protein